MKCNGSVFKVSRNLFNALQNLRGSEPFLIWADAICINQADVSEKNIQVPLMGSIYSQARTIVWLGLEDESEDGSRVLDLLIKFAEVRHAMESLEGDPVKYSKQLPQALDAVGLDLEGVQALPWAALYAFFRRPWFQRVWVNQEVACGYGTTFLIGKRSVSTAELQGAIGLMGDLEKLMARSTERNDDHGDFFELRTKYKQDRIQAWHTTRSHTLLLRRTEAHHDLRTVTYLRRCQTKDARDHIYGLFSTLADSRNHEVDYAKAVEVVYADFAWHCIRSSGTLMVLSEDSACRNGEVREEKRHVAHLRKQLPSWCPDWSGARHEDARSLIDTNVDEDDLASTWCASAGRSLQAKRLSPLTLQLRGMIVDIVEEVGTLFPDIEGLGSAERMLPGHQSAIFRDWEKFIAAHSPSPAGTSAVELTQRLLWFGWDIHDDASLADAADAGIEGDSALHGTLDMMSVFNCWANRYTTGDLCPLPLSCPEIGTDRQTAIADVAMYRAYYNNRGASIFATKRGYIGTATPDIAVGDLVCLLYGGQVPYIMRLHDNADPTYRFSSDCYIEGMMFGESVELDDIVEQDFAIV